MQNFNNFQKKIAFISINKYIGNGHETHHFWTFCGLFKVKGCTHTKGRQHNQPQQYVTLCQTSNFFAPKWKRLKFTSWVARLGKASECGGVNPGTNVFFFEYAVVELVQSDTWVFQHQATFDKHLCIQSIAFTFFVKQKRVYSETVTSDNRDYFPVPVLLIILN